MTRSVRSVPKVKLELGSRALLVRRADAAAAYVWDLFWPVVVALGGGACAWVLALPHALLVTPLVLLTKRARIRIDHEAITITWWWLAVPYRRRRYPLSGGFEDEGDGWSGEPASRLAFVPEGSRFDDQAAVWCRHPAAVVAFLAEARRELAIPVASTRPPEA